MSKENNDIQWSGVALHAGIALALMFVLAWFLPVWLLAIANVAFWLGRETAQHLNDPMDIFNRKQPLLEWVAPVIVGFVYATVWSLI